MALYICGQKGAYLINLSEAELRVLQALLAWVRSNDAGFAKFVHANAGLYAAEDLLHYIKAALNVVSLEQGNPLVSKVASAYKTIMGVAPTSNGSAGGGDVRKLLQERIDDYEKKLAEWSKTLKNEQPSGTVLTPPSGGIPPGQDKVELEPFKVTLKKQALAGTVNAMIQAGSPIQWQPVPPLSPDPEWHHDDGPEPDDDF